MRLITIMFCIRKNLIFDFSWNRGSNGWRPAESMHFENWIIKVFDNKTQRSSQKFKKQNLCKEIYFMKTFSLMILVLLFKSIEMSCTERWLFIRYFNFFFSNQSSWPIKSILNKSYFLTISSFEKFYFAKQCVENLVG